MIVMIAVLSAMVAPSITSSLGGSVKDEAERLQQTMRLALEEAQLSSVPLRWVGEHRGWYFEQLVQTVDGPIWQRFEAPPIEMHSLPSDIIVAEVRQSGEFLFSLEVKKTSQDEGEQPLGMVLLLPDGTVSPSEIVMSDTGGSGSEVLQVKSGPAGIRVMDGDSAALNK